MVKREIINYVQNKKGHFYKQINYEKIQKITKKEYLDKTTNNIKNINKLQKSLYPTQGNNYILLKYPKTFPTNIRGKYVPADYELANIIKFLWKKKIITLGWDSGYSHNKIDTSGFISTSHLTIDNKSVVDIFIKLFGKNKIKIFNYIINPEKNPSPGKNTRNKSNYNDKKYSKLLRIKIYKYFVAISFNNSLIKWISKKLKIKIPDIKKSLNGRRIIHAPFYKIIK